MMTAKIIVKCIIYNRELNRFLLVQRCQDDDTGADTWENAGGNIESGETPEAAAAREVREETGITDIAIKKVAYIALLEGELPDLLIVYLCETNTENVRLSFEHQAYIWADVEQCRELLPKTIVSDFDDNGIFDILRKNDKGE
ncbi:NUDIX domain-containing protein [uncultured Ruminococcus sp.]|uniref:NUDIX domain-containing protein n=1 Tax=uncultured Ruminococcus sp. TaxID=165186 RepID=UPI0026270769|nr:NUDIX domain-containing protein [uncultured Ruminococcus sp.]